MLHESNSFPGKAVKMLAKKTNTILLGFEEAKSRIKNARNMVVTGNPVKMKKIEFTEEERCKALEKLDLKADMPIILVFGGSQGAKAINEAIIDIIKNKINNNYQIMWAAGPKQYDIIKEELENEHISINNIQNVKIVPYIYNMEEVMNLSDVVVARSGAMTITEISIVGKPAIFIPLPNVSENHQEYNARVLEKVGSAKILLNKDLTANSLNENIQSIISDKEKMIQMGKNANKVAIANVQDRIYEEIKKLVKKV